MARVKKPKPATALPEPDTRELALNELGLDGEEANVEAVRDAFRSRLKAAHPDLNGGTDMLLRRLILARDLLMKTAPEHPQAYSLIENFEHTDEPVRIDITLAQAMFGGEVTVEVPALEVTAAHEPLSSLTDTTTLRVPLRAGLRSGDIVTVATDNAVHTEQRFRIHISTGDGVRVWGDDIWMTARIEPRLFAIGGLATLETPHGPHDVAIARETQPGSSLCLKGLGLPAVGDGKAGDLHVRLESGDVQALPYGEALGAFRARWIAA